MSNVQNFIPEKVKTMWHEFRHGNKQAELETVGDVGEIMVGADAEAAGWGVKEADERKKQEGASKLGYTTRPPISCRSCTLTSTKGLATQLALAYAIHKSFIFVRVPLTAAILPKVVRVLRSWGYDIGKRRVRR